MHEAAAEVAADDGGGDGEGGDADRLHDLDAVAGQGGVFVEGPEPGHGDDHRRRVAHGVADGQFHRKLLEGRGDGAGADAQQAGAQAGEGANTRGNRRVDAPPALGQILQRAGTAPEPGGVVRGHIDQKAAEEAGEPDAAGAREDGQVAQPHADDDAQDGGGDDPPQQAADKGLGLPVADQRGGGDEEVADHRRGLVEVLVLAVNERQRGDHHDGAADAEHAAEEAHRQADDEKHDNVHLPLPRKKLAELVLDGGALAERLADEDAADAEADELADVLAGADAAFGDELSAVVRQLAEAAGRVEIDLHRRQVAVVDAQHAVVPLGKADHAPHAQERVGVVDLDEHGHRQAAGEDEQVHQHRLVEGLGDEQDRVGPGSAGLIDLVLVDDEILAEDGELDGGPDGGEIFQFALEEFFVGQDADRIGAASLVGPGDLDGVEVGADEARRRRGLFDLGDDVEAAAAALGDGAVEVAALGQALAAGAERLKRHGLLLPLDLAAFVFQDVIEYVRHVIGFPSP